MENNVFEPCHDILAKKISQELAFTKEADYTAWKNSIKEKFRSLTGLDEIEKNISPDLNINIESSEKKEGYTLTRFTFASEVGTKVPCYLIVPDTGKKKYPVAITLQGHSTGFHNSVGIVKFDGDNNYQPRGQFGLQAVKEGFISLCIEQRGMGERRPDSGMRKGPLCNYTAMTALLLGRTVLGERIFDISRAIDALEYFPECDREKILITGNSGGGTASYYAACYDERIKLSVPSCAFCPYEESIIAVHHCTCNYIPNAYKYFEMQDLACLIAPRRLAVISGQKDNIFPIEGVRRGYKTVSEIFSAAGAAENCRLVETPREHWWCVDIVWPTIREEVKKLGWEL